MTNINIWEDLQKDINDLESLIAYQKDGITDEVIKTQARGILLNLQEHLKELIEN